MTIIEKNSNIERSFKAGDVIMKQGEKGESAYIIEDGKVEIFLETENGETQPIGTRESGAMIGEMSLVDGAPRTATVQALEDCTLLEITREDFERRLNSADPILRMTTEVILTRYRDTLSRAVILQENRTWPPTEAVELSKISKSNAVENVKIANEFMSALHSSELRLHYQPIINLQTGYIDGFEALMRWEHPEKGLISPGVFIPVIEESGLIVTASKWALSEALMALKRIEHKTGMKGDLFMSVNFSSHDFASEGFVDSVYNTISESDINASQLHLEITERILMGQPESAKETINMCRKAGMQVSIDDFGTGYSSLSYLHHFPIDILKIDQSFVRNMTQDEGALELVRSIYSLGKNMKMEIIAEGVETQEEAIILRDMGCDLCQGFYFAKPMEERDIMALVNDWKKYEF